MNLARKSKYFIDDDLIEGNNQRQQQQQQQQQPQPKQQHICCSTSIPSLFCHQQYQHHYKNNNENSIKKFDPIVSSVIAANLNELSLDEREQIFEDIHCVGKPINEDSDFILRSINSLEEELKKYYNSSCNKNKKLGERSSSSSSSVSSGSRRVEVEAFNLAMKMNSQYIQNKDFYLKFLRSVEYNIQHAAKRIIDHFKLKLELFGENKLVKDITFDDLSTEDQKVLCTGTHQFLGKDCIERKILFTFPELNIACSWETFARARWYQSMVAIEDESIQKNGIVVIIVWNKRSIYDKGNMKALKLIRETIPFRFSAVHNVFINEKMPLYIRAFLDILGKKIQVRTKFHFEESTLAFLYSLQSFGINPTTVPIDHDGLPKIDLFLKSLETRKILEQERIKNIKRTNVISSTGTDGNITTTTSTNTNTTTTTTMTDTGTGISIIPKSRDVLLGRGVVPNSHEGNKRLEKMIEIELSTYQRALTKFDKTCLVLQCIRHVEHSGGRFLHRIDTNTNSSSSSSKYNNNKKKKEKTTSTAKNYNTPNDNNNNTWYIADDKTVRESVSARIRNKAKQKRRNYFNENKTKNNNKNKHNNNNNNSMTIDNIPLQTENNNNTIARVVFTSFGR